jgi:hypothetical protein
VTLGDYGERVDGFGPFRLDRLDHRHHRNGAIHWRLSFDGVVIGYTSTGADDPAAAVTQLATEKNRRADAWTSDPEALVRRERSGSLVAMFAFASDAEAFAATKPGCVMETMGGRRIVGTTSHGYAILAALERSDLRGQKREADG